MSSFPDRVPRLTKNCISLHELIMELFIQRKGNEEDRTESRGRVAWMRHQVVGVTGTGPELDRSRIAPTPCKAITRTCAAVRVDGVEKRLNYA